ncbi:MAG: hypothetical protein ABJA67_14550 [Chthonomonadales bacterium]
MSDENQIDIDEAIDEALDGKPRSCEIGLMLDALRVRQKLFEDELRLATSDKATRDWKRKIKEVDAQVAVLEQEMAITEFVERTVIAMSKQSPYSQVQ